MCKPWAGYIDTLGQALVEICPQSDHYEQQVDLLRTMGFGVVPTFCPRCDAVIQIEYNKALMEEAKREVAELRRFYPHAFQRSDLSSRVPETTGKPRHEAPIGLSAERTSRLSDQSHLRDGLVPAGSR